MPSRIEGELLPGDARIAIVVSRFNDFITERLLQSAIETHRRQGGDGERLTVAHVPGSFELPVAAQKLARSGRFDAVICLGCVVRGQTDHYDYVAGEAAKGIGQVALQTGVPVVFGVITADTLEQAVDRAGAKLGNQGGKAMLAAIEMANLMKKL